MEGGRRRSHPDVGYDIVDLDAQACTQLGGYVPQILLVGRCVGQINTTKTNSSNKDKSIININVPLVPHVPLIKLKCLRCLHATILTG